MKNAIYTLEPQKDEVFEAMLLASKTARKAKAGQVVAVGIARNGKGVRFKVTGEQAKPVFNTVEKPVFTIVYDGDERKETAKTGMALVPKREKIAPAVTFAKRVHKSVFAPCLTTMEHIALPQDDDLSLIQTRVINGKKVRIKEGFASRSTFTNPPAPRKAKGIVTYNARQAETERQRNNGPKDLTPGQLAAIEAAKAESMRYQERYSYAVEVERFEKVEPYTDADGQLVTMLPVFKEVKEIPEPAPRVWEKYEKVPYAMRHNR